MSTSPTSESIRMKTADKFLDEAAETFRQRNAIYGNNFLHIGIIMMGLFPEGLSINTAEDWNRLHILLLQIVKLSRYCNVWDADEPKEIASRIDSMHDNTVYSAILESIDRMSHECEVDLKVNVRVGKGD